MDAQWWNVDDNDVFASSILCHLFFTGSFHHSHENLRNHRVLCLAVSLNPDFQPLSLYSIQSLTWLEGSSSVVNESGTCCLLIVPAINFTLFFTFSLFLLLFLFYLQITHFISAFINFINIIVNYKWVICIIVLFPTICIVFIIFQLLSDNFQQILMMKMSKKKKHYLLFFPLTCLLLSKIDKFINFSPISLGKVRFS